MSAYGILKLVADESGLTVPMLRSERRWRHLVAARKRAAVRLREAGYSYPVIGMLLGKHWTSAIAMCGALGRQQETKGNA